MVDHYVGCELDLFAQAHNWKSYVASQLAPWVRGAVLEVGAGIGSNIKYLFNSGVTSWHALEPDRVLAASLPVEFEALGLADKGHCIVGTLADLPNDLRFDTILYLDVLEHIENDDHELAAAVGQLTPEGRVIVLAPAHQFLFSPFDSAIGHFRRYSVRTLRALTPPGYRVVTAAMLDSVGLMASLANRIILRQSMPTSAQVEVWDRVMVPLSRLTDPMLARRVGKSIVMIWQHDGRASAIAGGR
jgi:SAM-dependent methyltransferase